MRRYMYTAPFALLCLLFLLQPLPATSQTTTPTPTIFATASVKAEQQRVKLLMAKYQGIEGLVWVDPEHIRAYPSADKQYFHVYIEAFVEQVADREFIAKETLKRTVEVLKFEPSDLMMIMFNGLTSESHLYERKEWTVTDLTLEQDIEAGLQVTATAFAQAKLENVSDDAGDIKTIQEWFNSFARNRSIESINIVNSRSTGGERMVMIAYRTTEVEEDAYVIELFDILSTLAEVFDNKGIDVDSVIVLVGTSNGKAAVMVTLYKKDLMAYHNGHITLDAFVDEISITPLS